VLWDIHERLLWKNPRIAVGKPLQSCGRVGGRLGVSSIFYGLADWRAPMSISISICHRTAQSSPAAQLLFVFLFLFIFILISRLWVWVWVPRILINYPSPALTPNLPRTRLLAQSEL
jgi:hypothetical protein